MTLSIGGRLRTARLVDDTVVRLYHWNGSGKFIEFAGPRQDERGVVLLEGVEGLMHAPIVPVRIQTARLPGSIPVTYRIEHRIFDLATLVTGPDSIAWQYYNKALLDMLSPKYDSPLMVQTLPWGPRWIGVRREKRPDDPIEEDPTWSKEQVWNWTLVAHDPDWRSRTLTSLPFTPTGSDAANGVLRVANRGTRPTYPKYSGKAGLWHIQDGVDGQWNPLPAMTAQEGWTVDSHPMAWQLQSTVDRRKWEKLQRGFTQTIDPETEAVIKVRVGAGHPPGSTVQMLLEQRFDEPWG